MVASRAEQLPDFPAPSHSRDAGDMLDGFKPWVTLGQFLSSREHVTIDETDVVRPSATRLAELSALEPGTGLRSVGIVEANRPGGHWGYRQDCFVADPQLPARTIRAASTPDWIRLSDGSLRRLTWRECAALQGFPEGWQFQGGLSPRFRQIGNAVQGDVGRAIGRTLFNAAREVRRARPVSPPWPSEFHRRVRYTAMEHAVNGRHREAARRGRFTDNDETPWLT
jgi:DNA (cytosine-5)-methyltransferase 1